MSEKEKAKELVSKMNYSHPEHELFVAKECAIIAVDEILSNIDATILYHPESNAIPINKEYWQEVKTEIQNL